MPVQPLWDSQSGTEQICFDNLGNVSLVELCLQVCVSTRWISSVRNKGDMADLIFIYLSSSIFVPTPAHSPSMTMDLCVLRARHPQGVILLSLLHGTHPLLLGISPV